ncbi:hypothetical protein IAR50_007595 [Cryptococcus sp. DSM 104548]
MTSSTDSLELELFGLGTKPQDPLPNFSPFVWMTKVDLAILGLSYKTNNKSFCEIRYELSKTVGDPDVTVPTLKVGDTFLQDSFQIALWLDDKYGKNNTLFGPSQGAIAHTQFLEQWARWTLAEPILCLVGPAMYYRLDPSSAVYYLRTKFGDDLPSLESLAQKASDPAYASSQWALVRSALKPIDKLLEAHGAKGKKLFFDGEKPTHADAIVFGWYAYARLVDGWEEGWESEDTGYVGKWLRNMTEIVSEKELP